MRYKSTLNLSAFFIAFLILSCTLAITHAQETNSGNERQRQVAAPDNSEVTTEEKDGVTKETRVFRDPDNPVKQVEVETAPNGEKTTKVYSRDGEIKELPREKKVNPLKASGKKIAEATGLVVEKTKRTVSAASDKTGEVIEKGKQTGSTTVEVSKNVIKKTGETAVAVGEKTDQVNGAVVEKAKDAGHATKTVALATASATKTATKKTIETTGDAAHTTIKGTKTISRKTVEVGGRANEKSKSAGRKIYSGMKRLGRAVKDVFTP